MVVGNVEALAGGVVKISARGWTQNHDASPGEGLTTVYRVAADNAYDINISNDLIETFYQYWYVWSTPSGIDQADTLYTQIYGTFGTGEGDDTITVDVYPPASQTQFQSAYILAGPGNDIITSADTLDDNALNAYGGSGDDSILGTWQDDLLYGDQVDFFAFWPTTTGFIPVAYDSSGDGNDTITALVGNDTIIGGGGDDILSGGQGNDLISSSSGSNQFFGGDGSDTITGGTGSDFLYGGPRGTGYLDVLSGGGGADVFMLSYSESANAGASFWGKYFEADFSTITGGAIKTALTQFFQEGVQSVLTGFASAALGAIGEVLDTNFLSWIENLSPSETPQADVLVVRDFDPSQDVLVLPISKDITLAEGLFFYNPDAAGDTGWGLRFKDGTSDKVFAEVTLGDDFLASVGLTQNDQAQVQLILNFVLSNATSINGSGHFSSLSDLSKYLVDGGFTPPHGTELPSGMAVEMFGAIGGLIYHSSQDEYDNSFIVGTRYADVLTINPVILPPETLTNLDTVFAGVQSEVHGLGGDDIIYGSTDSDVLRGGDGNDLLYSFKAGGTGEDIAGGAGDDTIYGGGSFGAFAGGDGTDTFGVFYGQYMAAMQLFVDLTTGQAGERAAPSTTTAPVGNAPPFTPASNDTYTLTGFENVLGGTLNDWIRMTAGGVVEAGAGADYIDATAGGVTFSYASSAAGVSVQLFTTGAKTSGGDAQGDVLDYAGGYPLALIGSDNADTLGGFSSGQFTVTGGGGTDLFQLVSVVPSAATVTYTITDFSDEDNDLIDLRLIGATRAQTELLGDRLVIRNPGGVAATINVVLKNYKDFLLADQVLFADSVSGTGLADPGGGGLSGGGGDDVLIGQSGGDFLFGNAGNDRILGNGGGDILDGGRGDDWLRGDDGDDRLSGGLGADSLLGGAGDDLILGGAGDDRVWAGDGDDHVLTGAGDDRVVAGDGGDLVGGGAGNDSIWGGAGDDRLLGGDGADSLLGNDGNDVIVGGAGGDSLFGGDGNDRLWGQDGNDQILGGLGADWIFGGAGSDTIDGGAGRDIIDGGAGADVMRGGADADIFRLTFGASDGDAILDFNAGEGDRLLILGDRPIAVSDLGDGYFSFTDGIEIETVRVAGATVSDFHQVIA